MAAITELFAGSLDGSISDFISFAGESLYTEASLRSLSSSRSVRLWDADMNGIWPEARRDQLSLLPGRSVSLVVYLAERPYQHPVEIQRRQSA